MPRRRSAAIAPLAATLCAVLGACANIVTPPAVSPPPANYRQLAADAAVAQFKTVALAGALISELREAKAPQLGQFAACLRTSVVPFDPATGSPAFGAGPGDFAVLFEDGKVLTIRRAVIIDRCGEGNYGPLPRGVIRKPGDGKTPPAAQPEPGTAPDNGKKL